MYVDRSNEMAPTPTTTPSTSNSTSSVSDAAGQMQKLAERLASHVAAGAYSASTVDGVTKIGLAREKEMLRIQLDMMKLQRTMDEDRHTRTLDQIRVEAADAVKVELSRGIVEMLQGEFGCTICNEVSEA
jgi:hypothetical protein